MLELFLSSLPDLHTILVVAPLAIVYGLIVSAAAGYLRIKRAVRTAYTRKFFHFSIFTMVTVVHRVWHLPGVTVTGIVMSLIVLFAVWRGDGFPLYEALARPSDEPHRTEFIIVPLLTTMFGGIATNIFFARYAFIGYLVCGWGDAVGEPVGSRWGRHKYKVPSMSGVPATRSVEGSVAVAISGSIAAIIGLFAYGSPTAHPIWVGLGCGTAGALIEAISTHGLDNFTTQLAAAAVASWLA